MMLTSRFISQIGSLDGVSLIGLEDPERRVAVVSLDFKDRDNGEIAAILDSNYGIMTRCGLHCAPIAHHSLNTWPLGTVRCSFGLFNTTDEVDYIVHSLKEVLRRGVNNGI
jgi:selenocysteine lyase/cysteine desulfurase